MLSGGGRTTVNQGTVLECYGTTCKTNVPKRGWTTVTKKAKGIKRGWWWKAFKHSQYIQMTLSFSTSETSRGFAKLELPHSTQHTSHGFKTSNPTNGWAEQDFWRVWGRPLVPHSYQSLANEALSNHRWQRWYQSQQPRTGCCCFDFPQGTPAIKYILHVIHNVLLTGC